MKGKLWLNWIRLNCFYSFSLAADCSVKSSGRSTHTLSKDNNSTVVSKGRAVGSCTASLFSGDRESFSARSSTRRRTQSNKLTVFVQSPCPGPVWLDVSFVSGCLGFPPGRGAEKCHFSVVVRTGTRNRPSVVWASVLPGWLSFWLSGLVQKTCE